MTTRAELLAELDAIDAVARQLTTIPARRDPQRKQDLIAARRELAGRMAAAMTIGERFAPIRQNESLYAELRHRVSVLRAAIADHQAQWSAVAIDSDDEAYLLSASSVHGQARDFMSWVRQIVEASPE